MVAFLMPADVSRNLISIKTAGETETHRPRPVRARARGRVHHDRMSTPAVHRIRAATAADAAQLLVLWASVVDDEDTAQPTAWKQHAHAWFRLDLSATQGGQRIYEQVGFTLTKSPRMKLVL